ncbi:unnamed protein product, partial [Penicillium discolor]
MGSSRDPRSHREEIALCHGAHLATQTLDPLAHPNDPSPSARRARSHPVAARTRHLDQDGIRDVLHEDIRHAVSGMLPRVGDALLHDAHHGETRGAVQHPRLSPFLEPNRLTGRPRAGDDLRDGLQCRFPGVVGGRLERAEKTPQVDERRAAALGDGGEDAARLLVEVRPEPARLGLDHHRGHVMRDHIMQFPRDARALRGDRIRLRLERPLSARRPLRPEPGAPEPQRREHQPEDHRIRDRESAIDLKQHHREDHVAGEHRPRDHAAVSGREGARPHQADQEPQGGDG